MAGRAAANAVYVPPGTQAELDTQSGLLHAEEGDHVTAYSYFYEAHEAYAALGSPRAPAALKYMLLSRVMRGEAGEVEALAGAKAGAAAGCRDVEAMRAVARAYASRSLHGFQAALDEYDAELRGDAAVATHLEALYDTMLENNLLRLLEPYSRVEVARLAALIDLPAPEVEAKLSRMILDKQFYGAWKWAGEGRKRRSSLAGRLQRSSAAGAARARDRGRGRPTPPASLRLRSARLRTVPLCTAADLPVHLPTLKCTQSPLRRRREQARWTKARACWRCGTSRRPTRSTARRSTRLTTCLAPWTACRPAPSSSWPRRRDFQHPPTAVTSR